MAKYIAPTWVNDAPPYLGKGNLQPLTDTAQGSQKRVGDILYTLRETIPHFAPCNGQHISPSAALSEALGGKPVTLDMFTKCPVLQYFKVHSGSSALPQTFWNGIFMALPRDANDTYAAYSNDGFAWERGSQLTLSAVFSGITNVITDERLVGIGADGSTVVSAYTPDGINWQKGVNVPIGAANLKIVNDNNSLYAYGGKAFAASENSFNSWRPKTLPVATQNIDYATIVMRGNCYGLFTLKTSPKKSQIAYYASYMGGWSTPQDMPFVVGQEADEYHPKVVSNGDVIIAVDNQAAPQMHYRASSATWTDITDEAFTTSGVYCIWSCGKGFIVADNSAQKNLYLMQYSNGTFSIEPLDTTALDFSITDNRAVSMAASDDGTIVIAHENASGNKIDTAYGTFATLKLEKEYVKIPLIENAQIKIE